MARNVKRLERKQWRAEKRSRKKEKQAKKDQIKEELLLKKIEEHTKQSDKSIDIAINGLKLLINQILSFISYLKKVKTPQQVDYIVSYYSNILSENLAKYDEAFDEIKEIAEKEKENLDDFSKDAEDEIKDLKQAVKQKQREVKGILAAEEQFEQFLKEEKKRAKAIVMEENMEQQLEGIDEKIKTQTENQKKILEDDLKRLEKISSNKDELKRQFSKKPNNIQNYIWALKKIISVLRKKISFYNYLSGSNREFKRYDLLLERELDKKEEIYKKLEQLEAYSLHELLLEETTAKKQHDKKFEEMLEKV
ncbi:hypothetical protein GF361_02780 [Candidatus Woesearchaeota archaeon]|nr:hypothetical protein [Candidatus Woesearchaeota archaeon]